MPEQRYPLIFALQHLHVRFPEEPQSADAFNRSARLMQDDREMPQADDAEIARFLADDHNATAPTDAIIEMLRMTCPGWPDAVIHALQGITEFGAYAVDVAAARAQTALQMDRGCKLARQLVKLLTAKQDVRVLFGSDTSNAPDVPRIIGV